MSVVRVFGQAVRILDELFVRDGITTTGYLQAMGLGSAIKILDDSGDEQFNAIYNGVSAVVFMANGINTIAFSTADGATLFYQDVTFNQDVSVSGNVNAGGNFVGDGDLTLAKAGGATITGQSTTGGFVTPLSVQAKNSAGTVVGSYGFSNQGLLSVANPSGLTVSFQLTSGWGRAPGWGTNAEVNKGTVTSTVTVDWKDGFAQKLTMTASTALTVTFAAPPLVSWLTLKVTYPAGGVSVPAITWPGTVKWAQGAQPTGTKTLGRTSVYRFYYDGTNYWGDAILNAG